MKKALEIIIIHLLFSEKLSVVAVDVQELGLAFVGVEVAAGKRLGDRFGDAGLLGHHQDDDCVRVALSVGFVVVHVELFALRFFHFKPGFISQGGYLSASWNFWVVGFCMTDGVLESDFPMDEWPMLCL